MPTDYLAALIQPKRAAIQAATPAVANVLRLLQMFPSNDPAYPESKPATTPGENLGLQEMARRMVRNKFGPGQFGALDELLTRESSWDLYEPRDEQAGGLPATSTAADLFQFLDSTRENYNLPLHAGPKKQLRAGLQYISDRYGTPTGALKFHNANNFY